MASEIMAEVAAEPAIDLGPLPGLVGYAIRRAQLAIHQDFHRTFEVVDLSPAEFSVLLIVQRNPGLRQRRIGDVLAILPPNLVGLVGRLAARRLLERRVNPSDRRAVALFLTSAGEDVLRHALQLLEEHEGRVTAHLGLADRRKLLKQLTELTALAEQG